MTGQPDFWAVIPAGGVGRRMGADRPKQYLKLLDRTVLEHSMLPFCEHPLIKGIVVVVADGDEFWPALAPARHPRVVTAPGGHERCHSVLNGLKRLAGLADDGDWVLVHDAARPCVSGTDIDSLIDGLRDHPVGGVLAQPVRDTVKQVAQDHAIEATLERERLWRALTPQMFRLGVLREAIGAAAGESLLVTDEAQALEHSGYRPAIVPGGAHNIKVSLPEDLALAEFYLKRWVGSE
ncbi:MAG: 2-C-methyl-D-erythritol 4-phosphate cytidylyltransferase [Gammaproteobacteria bacterium]|nr:2-C-methyl-D-erythritol 4-phosphate cytidylyltransferase [Gammaproteobacteria bacterium]MYH68937.1 2-C-methyl-D-erythritol 4-phosphate cytidylyltransferase [Gammaproteobacteria bacterium]